MKWMFVLFVIFLAGCDLEGITGRFVEKVDVAELNVPSEEGNISVYFCPRDGCEEKLYEFLDNANSSIHCALFELELESLKEVMDEKSSSIDVKLVVDKNYQDEVSELEFVRFDNNNQLTHNKFCIVDGKRVFTGSFNPTRRGSYFNNNNMLLIDSLMLSSNYEAEFDELWGGVFGDGERVENPKLVFNGFRVENYFCPDDSCAARVVDEIRKAEHNVYFMTFSFTHPKIGTMLALKMDDGIIVKGVYEKRNLKGSTYGLLSYQGANVKGDDNPYNLHHKVFIIDNKTVVTGSFNPTKAGDNRNDENLLIIEDSSIAAMFLKEFEFVWNFNNSKLGKKREAKNIIISEVDYDPEGSDTGKEYVKLLNIGNSSVDLSYWRLSDGKSNFVLNGSVDSGGEIKVMPKFSLKNSNGLIILKDRSMNNVDYAAYEGIWEIEAITGERLVRSDKGYVNCEECWTIQ